MSNNSYYSLIKKLESSSDDDLETAFSAESLGIGFPGKRLRDWLSENGAPLRKQICNSNLIKLYLENPNIRNRVLIVAGIADLISSMLTGVSALVVAELIVREGISNFCGIDSVS